MKATLGHLILLSLNIIGCTASYEEKELFLSSQKESWIQRGTANWNWEDGVITGTSSSGSSFLMTREIFQNFELSLEFYPDSTVNSGVFVRCSNSELSATDCYEFNIWDLHPNQDFRTGALVGKTIPKAFVQTLNQWNSYVVKAEGAKLQAWVNDQLTVEVTNDDLLSGFIAIQTGESGTIRFRNIKIKYLPN